MNNTIDLTTFGDRELSLVVFNDELLYRQRHHIGFRNLLEDMFTFTDEQWEVLELDLEEELKEDEDIA